MENQIRIRIIIVLMLMILMLVMGLTLHAKHLRDKYPWHIYETQSYALLDEYNGEGVTIAYLDTGLSEELQNHFGDRIVNPYNVIEGNSIINDLNGHGTSIICISACEFNVSKVYGLAYKSLIMPVVVMDSSAKTNGELISEGIYYAVDNGANIINLSLGARLDNTLVEEAIEYAYDNNVIVVASVGDYNEDSILFPARHDKVISVQAQSKLGVKYKTASWGDSIDMIIPGEFLETIGYDSDSTDLKITYESGSSISTSFFSSVIALMIQGEEDFQVEELIMYIRGYDYSTEFINIYDFVSEYKNR